MTRRLLIVGAGELGREILGWALDIESTQTDWRVAGFLDGNAAALEGYERDYSILGSIDGYEPQPNDVLTVAIGNPVTKLSICRELAARGARFATLIHPTCVIGRHNSIGEGTVICPYSTISTNVTIGRYVLMNTYASIGHDCVVGDGCTINGHCSMNGRSQLAEGVFLGGHAVINPSAKVGEWARVGAGSTVLHRVRPHTTVFGVPARRIWDARTAAGPPSSNGTSESTTPSSDAA